MAKIDISFKQTKRDQQLLQFLISLDDRGYWIKEKLYKAMLEENKEDKQVIENKSTGLFNF